MAQRKTSFSADLKAFAQKTGLTLDQVHRGVAIKLFSAVVMDTPVLDGFLRGSWYVSTESPKITSAARKDSEGSVVNAEIAGIEAKAGTVTYFTNSMPYAYRIEYEGWSSVKAPQGMVRKNVARFQQIVADAVKETKK